MTRVYSETEIRAGMQPGRVAYSEFLRAQALSAGIYRLPEGAADPQKPHTEDEIYYVLAGAGRFTASGETREVGRGDIIYVPAGEEHRFSDIRETLELLVVFAPAERSG